MSYSSFETAQDQYIWFLFSRVNTLGEEVMFLLEHGKYVVGRIALRSMLESFIDLKCLVDDPSYVGVLKKADVLSELQFLKKYNPDNPYYGHLTPSDVKAKREKLQKRINIGKSMSIEEKFKKAKDTDAYHAVYTHFNTEVHANASTLAIHGTGQGSKAVFDQQYKFTLITTVNLCIASAVEASDKLESMQPFHDEFKSHLEKANNVWKKNA